MMTTEHGFSLKSGFTKLLCTLHPILTVINFFFYDFKVCFLDSTGKEASIVKLEGVALLEADPPQFNSTTRQNQPI